MTAFPDSATRWGPSVETVSSRDAFPTTLQPFPGFQTLPSTISLSYLHSLYLRAISYNLLENSSTLLEPSIITGFAKPGIDIKSYYH